MRSPKLSTLFWSIAALWASSMAAQAQTTAVAAPEMTPAEVEQGKKIYFERCAGCHGVLRKGATGKNLEPHWSKKDKDGNVRKAARSSSVPTVWKRSSRLGTEGGMVNYDDILTKEEINIMARYIQRTPDVPPEFSLKDMEASWKLLVPVDQRPKKPA
jgi:nitrite reductase (NO-forming)/hydroxylamine reductase